MRSMKTNEILMGENQRHSKGYPLQNRYESIKIWWNSKGYPLQNRCKSIKIHGNSKCHIQILYPRCVSKRIQTYPNLSKRNQTYPKVSKRIQKNRVSKKIQQNKHKSSETYPNVSQTRFLYPKLTPYPKSCVSKIET